MDFTSVKITPVFEKDFLVIIFQLYGGTMNNQKLYIQGLPGGSEVRTLSFHCTGLRFDPWSGNYNPHD